MNKKAFASLQFVIIALLLGLQGCFTKLDWDPLEFDPKPVINGVIVAQQPIDIMVSMASEFSTEPAVEVENAQVNLFENGMLLETLEYHGEGIYRGQLLAQENHEYRCEVSIPQYETAICSTFIPRPREIIDVKHYYSAWIDEEGIVQPGVKVTFESIPDTLTYYLLLIKVFDDDEVDIAWLGDIVDPLMLSEGIPIAVFSNKQIEANSYTLHLNYNAVGYHYTNTTGWVASKKPIQVELRTICANYYHFIKQQYLYELSNDEPFFSIGVTGTFNLHSNVENGYGILAGYSSVLSDIIDSYEDEN